MLETTWQLAFWASREAVGDVCMPHPCQSDLHEPSMVARSPFSKLNLNNGHLLIKPLAPTGKATKT